MDTVYAVVRHCLPYCSQRFDNCELTSAPSSELNLSRACKTFDLFEISILGQHHCRLILFTVLQVFINCRYVLFLQMDTKSVLIALSLHHLTLDF